MANKSKPWLDENGEPLTDEQICRTKNGWSLSEWEEFLKGNRSRNQRFEFWAEQMYKNKTKYDGNP